MPIKKNDFIEIEYTGMLKEDNIIFDTTNEEIAKQSSIDSKNASGPIIICVGQGQVLPGLDKQLEGKEFGNYKIELKAEEAFGRKNPKLIQLMPTNKFISQKVQPFPGLQVDIDGVFGTIKTVSGGRTIVDFNHPLSGKDIVYDITIKKRIDDDKEKLSAYLKNILPENKPDVTVKDNEAIITLENGIEDKVKENLAKRITELIPAFKKIHWDIQKLTLSKN